jgi:beta-lactam-binding protein with PASTA domain
MRLDEISAEPIMEARMVWKRSGNKVVRAVRCTSGRRKGRVVSTSSQCGAPLDIKKKINIKRLKSRMGTRLAKKSKRTRRVNPASRRLRTLNRPQR